MTRLDRIAFDVATQGVDGLTDRNFGKEWTDNICFPCTFGSFVQPINSNISLGLSLATLSGWSQQLCRYLCLYMVELITLVGDKSQKDFVPTYFR